LNDSIGLKKYYDQHKNNYTTKPCVNAKIYSLRKENGLKSLSKTYKKYAGKEDADELMMIKLNKGNDSLFTITSGKWYKGDNQDIDKTDWTKGVYSTIVNGIPSLIVINETFDSEPLPFNMIQNEMVAGYQDQLEQDWIEQLKGKYSVKINSLVLEEIRKTLNNE
jgi:peptidyl-prolyl cis-trans isomerase SurA